MSDTVRFTDETVEALYDSRTPHADFEGHIKTIIDSFRSDQVSNAEEAMVYAVQSCVEKDDYIDNSRSRLGKTGGGSFADDKVKRNADGSLDLRDLR